MKRRVLSFLLVFALGFSVFGQNASDFSFEVRNGTITIKGLQRKGSTREVVIPGRINNIPVTVIGEAAFYNNQLVSVIIPNSVTAIEGGAFDSNQLTNVIIPNSVTSIGIKAFASNQLTSVIIPNSISSIKEGAFAGNKLTSVSIPNSVTSIEEDAFHLNKLTNVTIPDSVASIGASAFSDNQLTSVTIPASVINIGFVPFHSNPGLTAINVSPNNPNYSSINGVLYNKNGTVLLQWPAGISGTITIPNSVVTIGRSAFNDLQLTSITIPDSVTEIGARAFRDNRLTSVIIPNSVTSIGERAFADNQLTSVTIPNSVNSIGEYAFTHNPLTSVTFVGNRVTLQPFSFGLHQGQLGANETRNMFVRGDLRTVKVGNENFVNTNLVQLYTTGGAGTYQRDAGSPYWAKR